MIAPLALRQRSKASTPVMRPCAASTWGLVVQKKFVAFQGVAQIGLQAQACLDVGGHLLHRLNQLAELQHEILRCLLVLLLRILNLPLPRACLCRKKFRCIKPLHPQ